jgi:hypothetical protein
VAWMFFSPLAKVCQGMSLGSPAWVVMHCSGAGCRAPVWPNMQCSNAHKGCVAWVQVNADQALPAQASVRGAYINSGSRDAGPDRPLSDIGSSAPRSGR